MHRVLADRVLALVSRLLRLERRWHMKGITWCGDTRLRVEMWRADLHRR